MSLPKFHSNTPVPANTNDIVKLHELNISSIVTYLWKNEKGIPDNINFMSLHPSKIPFKNCQTLSKSHPFYILRMLLKRYQLVMIPADKTRVLVILPKCIYSKELQSHLSDTQTYSILTPDLCSNYVSIQKDAVTDATVYYNNPKLIVNDPSKRYIYFLPKIHKDINDWRVPFIHPKMRPIVSDTNSITHNLSNFLLPTLHNLEHKIKSCIPSSLAVVANIDKINSSIFSFKPNLATIDVESLFTNICQEKLLDIVNVLLIENHMNNDERQHFIQYLSIIVKYNTFQVNDFLCWQKIGLPMGGVLSGCLANIFLGFLEEDLYKLSGIVLYQRYMDDILLITNFSNTQLAYFIDKLKTSFNLSITSSSNHHSVNFLDISITYSPVFQKFLTYCYSKRHLMFPLPSTLFTRGFVMDKNIIISQILRAWRVSNHTIEFSRSINNFVQYLLSTNYHKKLRTSIFTFLLPLKISSHIWSATFPICSSCENALQFHSISVVKVLNINDKYVSTKQPIKCCSSSIFIIIKQLDIFRLVWIPSVHWLLRHVKNQLESAIILPVGALKANQLKSFLFKHTAVQFYNKENVLKRKKNYSCNLYNIFHNTKKFYGVPSSFKKVKCVSSYFNEYKHISKCQ